MKILVVYTHPVENSFNRALLNATIEGLQSAGHEIRVADLYAEKFQPAMIAADFAQFEGRSMPDEILFEQSRVEWSDAMIFIFPLWWWSMPAMLKGWIDRVVSYGWAWVDPPYPESGPLRQRKILVMLTAGASHAQLEKHKYDEALDTQLNIGTWNYCGIRDVTIRIFDSVDVSSPKHLLEGYLVEAEQLCG
jgi:NAD(P)H dehydrogenase (quinone)